ncbi:MAG: L-proline glycine betaine binding transporter protein ProX, partial [Acidimicrobiia bacterium]|nr:L-proline glycine betaine binding transporter protein ProX [Acidimicrobiia bacterium]
MAGLSLAGCSHNSSHRVAPLPVATTQRPAPTTTAAVTTTPSTIVTGPQAAFVFRPLDVAGIATYSALASGAVQLAAVYSTQAALVDPSLVVLADDKSLQPAQNLVPIGRAAAIPAPAQAVLDAVSAKLTTEQLRIL